MDEATDSVPDPELVGDGAGAVHIRQPLGCSRGKEDGAEAGVLVRVLREDDAGRHAGKGESGGVDVKGTWDGARPEDIGAWLHTWRVGCQYQYVD